MFGAVRPAHTSARPGPKDEDRAGAAAGASARDRPRERLARLGAGALGDAELLALVLRSGGAGRDALATAREALARLGGLRGLSQASLASLSRLPGLGPAKAASLLATRELAQRLAARPLERGAPIRGPVDVQRHFAPGLPARTQESFSVLLLDGRHRLIAIEEVSRGTLTASLVHPREVFREAIRCAAAALILVHNHPSGDPSPSGEDRSVTRRLGRAGELIGIRVLDHVIVAEGGHYSFREAGDWPEGSPTPGVADGE